MRRARRTGGRDASGCGDRGAVVTLPSNGVQQMSGRCARVDSSAAAEVVVVVGASAGGVEALTKLAAVLQGELAAAVLVVLHESATAPSMLAEIIDRAGPLPAVAATQGTVVQSAKIYTAIPDRHLLVHDQRLALSDEPAEHWHRPSIDALFRSAAADYGTNAIGLLLSGMLDDGVAGLRAIKAAGGSTLVQQPAEAAYPDMPLNALKAGVVDYNVPVQEMGRLLQQLVNGDRIAT
jgi:two-component system, chemotaxis family, protein-glutamate methylesterase/glutaminase